MKKTLLLLAALLALPLRATPECRSALTFRVCHCISATATIAATTGRLPLARSALVV